VSALRQPRRFRLLPRPGTRRNSAGSATTRQPASAVDHDVLTVREVARILRCSIQSARSIPETELARYRGPGRHLLYLRADVIAYVRSRRRRNVAADELMREIETQVLDSASDSGRGRSTRRRTP